MIRRATPADADALLPLMEAFADVHGHAYDRDWAAGALAPLLANPSLGVVLVVDVDDRLRGYAVLTWGWSLESGGREALLDEIFVESRGQGLGSQLLQAVLDACRAAETKVLFLETEAANERVRTWYARHGFAQETSIWMRLPLEGR
jgi:ribosomal protein S18 acetylase RimI-like enzyme